MTVSETTETTETTAARQDAAPDRPSRIGPWLLPAALVALIVATAVALGGIGVALQRSTADDRAAGAATVAARQLVTELITTDPDRAEESFARLRDGASGEFARQLAEQSGTFAESVTASDVRSEGTVLQAGVAGMDAGAVTVLVSAEATVSNAQVPDGEPRQYRMRLTLEEVEDRWLVSTLEFVP